MPQRASRRTAKFNRELALALRCCCDSFHCGGNADLVSLGNVEWAAFLQLVGFHRIEGIVWNALRPVRKELPDGVAAALSAASSEIAARNLVAAAASRQILQSFETAGIPVLFLKGLSVGALAYGKSSIKSAIDVDILVGPSDLAKAAELVRENHFQLTAPGDQPNSTALEDWHQSWKESVWMTESPSVQLDLHTRLADNPRLLPRMDVHSPRQLVDVGNGISLPTLATAELFAYLAVHGASSAWFRLKWISDFAGFLDRSARGSVAASLPAIAGAGRRAGSGTGAASRRRAVRQPRR